MSRTILNEQQATETVKALTFHRILAEIDISKVPVISTERHPAGGRKELAKMARALFRKLELKRISVTSPNYSMAMTVDVRLPRRLDYIRGADGHVAPDCPARVANYVASAKVEAILLKAFPNTDNRSDIQSDHFDYIWSIR